jgi:Amidase
MTDYANLTLAEAATQIRQKALSPVEYLQALLARIDTYDAHYNAFLRQTPDIALRQARQAEAEIMAGTWRGLLHGVPYGLKDIIDVAGVPTTAHSKILADNLARTDAMVTQRLHAAGGVLVGKLATHEFAMGGPPGRVERSCAVFRPALCSPFAPAFRFRECHSMRPCTAQSLSLTEACLRDYRTSLFIQSFTTSG